MSKYFYAKGKLLLTSEYAILHGAKALAVPLKLGQSLSCRKKNEQGVLSWKAYYGDKSWFETSIQISDLSIIQSSSEAKSLKIITYLENCIMLNPQFADELNKWDVRTDLEFDPGWGLGSSSTLLSLLAQWADLDPYSLFSAVSTGSGFDLACATADTAILYQLKDGKPHISAHRFQPPFTDKLWLVYQGKKQDSEESVAAFLDNYQISETDKLFFSNFTEDILRSRTVDEFGRLLLSHEKHVSELTSLPRIGELFNDFDGYIKSLGAWGGDFALFASERDAEYVYKYFASHQIDTYFSYKDLVIS